MGQGPSDLTTAHDPLSNAIRLAAMTPPLARNSSDSSYFLPNQQLVASALSPLPYTPSTSSMRAIEQPMTCHCLEEHSQLLCQLKNLAQGQSILGIDAILTGVQQALAPWQNLIHCSVCLSSDGHPTIVLSLMSIRILLRHIQRIFFGVVPSTSGQTTPEMFGPPGGVNSSASYQPGSSCQNNVTDILVVHALRKIKFTLHSLQGRFTQSRNHKAAAATEFSNRAQRVTGPDGVPISLVDSEPDMEVIQQLFDNLERTVHVVVNALRARNSVSS